MKNIIKTTLISWTLVFWLSQDIIAQTKSELYKNIFQYNKHDNVIHAKPETEIVVDQNIGTNEIYLAINQERFWQFIWDSKKWKYILQRHSYWEVPLILEPWNEYEIVLVREKEEKSLDNISDTDKMINKLLKNPNKLNIEISKYENYIQKIIQSSKIDIENSEYITYLDKSLQIWFIAYYDIEKKDIKIMWYDKISTWNKERWSDYFDTPNIIINRANFAKNDRKALGTDSMWYWPEWTNIYWLGKYYISSNGDKVSLSHTNWLNEFHFALHWTTPWWETMLWNPMSKWCIRVSSNMIKLFSTSGILDWKNWKYLIIGDYQEQEIWNWIYLSNDQNSLKYIELIK